MKRQNEEPAWKRNKESRSPFIARMFENPFVFYKHRPPQEWNSVKIQGKRKHDHWEAYVDANAQTLFIPPVSSLKLVVVLVVSGDFGL